MTAALKIVMTLKPVLLIAQQGYSGGFGKCFFSLFLIPELLTKSQRYKTPRCVIKQPPNAAVRCLAEEAGELFRYLFPLSQFCKVLQGHLFKS